MFDLVSTKELNMTLDEQLLRANNLAIEVHKNQFDKNMQPYINHVLRVMNAGQTIEEKIVGALHDVVEDSDLTIADLKEMGFSLDILDAVHAMTYDKDSEAYDEYIDRVIQNPIAVRVKLNDLTDNMDIRRLDSFDKEAIERLKKYFNAYKKIINSFK